MRKLMLLTLLCSALVEAVAAAIFLHFNVWEAAYYYPGRYEDAFAATLGAAMLAVLGIVGMLVATLLLWRRKAPDSA